MLSSEYLNQTLEQISKIENSKNNILNRLSSMEIQVAENEKLENIANYLSQLNKTIKIDILGYAREASTKKIVDSKTIENKGIILVSGGCRGESAATGQGQISTVINGVCTVTPLVNGNMSAMYNVEVGDVVSISSYGRPDGAYGLSQYQCLVASHIYLI